MSATENLESPNKAMSLREITGAGVADCKAALVDCRDDLAVAARYLQNVGLAISMKIADGETGEWRPATVTERKLMTINGALWKEVFKLRSNLSYACKREY